MLELQGKVFKTLKLVSQGHGCEFHSDLIFPLFVSSAFLTANLHATCMHESVIHLEIGSSESRDSHSQKPASPSDKRVSPTQHFRHELLEFVERP